MQENEQILANAIAKALVKLREKTGKSLNLFCNEYSIPTATLNEMERAKVNTSVFSLYRVLKAYDLSSVEFFKLVEKELPENFMAPEI